MSKNNEPVLFEDVEVLATTDLALLCDIEGDEHWIPKSQILNGGDLQDDAEKGDKGELVIPEWLAVDEGLV